jgi:hypothetical protein
MVKVVCGAAGYCSTQFRVSILPEIGIAAMAASILASDKDDNSGEYIDFVVFISK